MKSRMMRAILAASVLLAASASSAESKQCKSKAEQMVAPGLFPESSARTAARLGWMHLVQAKFGQQWSNPGFAESVSIACSKAPTGVGGFVYTCIHRARPCRP